MTLQDGLKFLMLLDDLLDQEERYAISAKARTGDFINSREKRNI